MPCQCSTNGTRDEHVVPTRDSPPRTRSLAGFASESDPESDTKPCNGPHCENVKKDNLNVVFPELRVRPRPEPKGTTKDDHDAWTKEYQQWGHLTCPCFRGYFCREHGSWIPGADVGSGLAPPLNEQKPGRCPAYHYDYTGVTSYIGERDASMVYDDTE